MRIGEWPSCNTNNAGKKLVRNSTLVLVAALALAGNTWFYALHVLVPMQKADAIAHQVPRGNLSDLYPRWLGARELLLHGRDPYSREITREIQIGYYGRPLDANRPNDPKDQEGFAYPVYVVFLLAPTVLLPFALVEAVSRWIFIAVITATVVLWFKALQWRVSRSAALIAVVFALGNFPAIQALALRQLSIVVAGLLGLVFFLAVRRKFLLAGLVLALATIKPQLAIPVASWLGLWTLGGWRERKGLLLGFLAGMAILVASAQWILPGWIPKFYYAVFAYRKYTGGATAADVLFGVDLGRATNVLLVLITGIICWQLRHKSEKSVEFIFASCFVLAAAVAIAPIFAPYNQLLLFPAFLALVQHRNALLPKTLWQKLLLQVAILMICWQWIACIFLTIIYCLISTRLVERIWAMPFYASLPLPIMVMCLLYVCFRVIRPPASVSQNAN
jgi:hypothetical protein